MSWEVFYFVCFLVGFFLSAFTLASGAAHLHPHLPRAFHWPGGAGAGHTSGPLHVPWLNFGTLTVFLAWFGGAGFLLTRYSNVYVLLAIAVALVSGLAGAALVFWFLMQIELRERALDPADYNMIGVLGQVSSTVRPGGTGEMIFSQAGVRRCAYIRSEDNRPIAKGTEVVIMRFENGIAYVRPWDEVSEFKDSVLR